MVLLGIVPLLTHTPPISCCFSIRATRLPDLAAWMAARWPAGPEPITITSYFCIPRPYAKLRVSSGDGKGLRACYILKRKIRIFGVSSRVAGNGDAPEDYPLLPATLSDTEDRKYRALFASAIRKIPALFAFQNHSRQRLEMVSHDGERHGGIKCFAVMQSRLHHKFPITRARFAEHSLLDERARHGDVIGEYSRAVVGRLVALQET